MPSDDKKGLRSLINPSRRDILRGIGSTVAKDLIPFAAKEILAAKPLSPLEKINAVKPLLLNYMNLEDQLDKLPITIWGEDAWDTVPSSDVHMEYKIDSFNNAERFLNDLTHVMQEQKRLNKPDRLYPYSKRPHEFIENKEEEIQYKAEVNKHYKDMMKILTKPSGGTIQRFGIDDPKRILKLDSDSIKFIRKTFELQNDKNNIVRKAAGNKLPFNYFYKKLFFPETSINVDEAPTNKNILDKSAFSKENINYYLKQEKELKRLSTDKGYNESVQFFTGESGKDDQGKTIVDESIRTLRNRIETNPIEGWDHYNIGGDDLGAQVERIDSTPDTKKIIFDLVKTGVKDAAKDIALQQGERIVTWGIEKLKTPSVPKIESDKVRAEQAKEVKEVKQETKKEVKPSSNLIKKLKTLGAGLSRKLKYSPTGLVLYATKIDPEGTSELPLDPRAIEIERALERGRVSRDPYKNYNKQRAI